jgi:hypothetical protein
VKSQMIPIFIIDERERYVLIGSDGGKVLVDKFVAVQSPILASNIEEAKSEKYIAFFFIITIPMIRQGNQSIEIRWFDDWIRIKENRGTIGSTLSH